MQRFLWLLFTAFLVQCTCSKNEPSPQQTTAPRAVVPAQTAGKTFSLKGKVTFSGKAPADTIKMNADKVCIDANKGRPVAQNMIVVGQSNGLANAFISINEGSALGIKDAPAEHIVLDQRACLYRPHVIGIRVGQPLKILNSDATMHNVNALSKTGQGFNSGMPGAGQRIEKTFSKAEKMIKVKCDVHGWMNAFIGVMDHPFFAVSSQDGSFEISGLPEGTFTAEIWHEKLGIKTASIQIKGGHSEISVTYP